MDERGEAAATLRVTSVSEAERYRGYLVESARLRGWDYSSEGLYFVTICVRDRQPVFGEIVDGELRLSGLGVLAGWHWLKIAAHHPNALADAFVVMPNHVHGIVRITRPHERARGGEGGPRRDVACYVSPASTMPVAPPGAGSLGAIVRGYKAAVSRWAQGNGYSGFAWQGRYYDHIIRDEESLLAIRRYIGDNPANSRTDEV